MATANRRLLGSRCIAGASWFAMKSMAEAPSTAPDGETRNTSRPAPVPSISPTAPVSQNSIPRLAASSAAGLEIVLP